MVELKNNIYQGSNGRGSLVDFSEPIDENYQDIIVFIHGYKGFKDWGAWNLVSKYFTSAGVAFCKFNLSHNGGTTTNPIDFPDLEAFSNNKYSYGLKDVSYVIDWLETIVNLENKKIHLVGHSRGGGLAILASKDPRVNSVITWASIFSIESQFPTGDELEKWKDDGYFTVKNKRTNQDMPIRYSIYEDWLENKDLLDIEKAAKAIQVPILHLHGDVDESVPVTASEKLSAWSKGKLMIIKNANHVFNTYHPYDQNEMPNKLFEACVLTLHFIEKLED